MQYDQFVGQVQHRARLGSTGQAVAAIRATLETLAERLAGGEAKDLAAQLPREIAYYLLQGIPEMSEPFGFNEFAWRVAQREGVDLPKAIFHARAVMEVLSEAVSPGELEDVFQQLPPDFAPLFAGTGAVNSNRSERRSMRDQNYSENYRGQQDRWEEQNRRRGGRGENQHQSWEQQRRGPERRSGSYREQEMAQGAGGYRRQNWNQGQQDWAPSEPGWEEDRGYRGFDEDRWRQENQGPSRQQYSQQRGWDSGYGQQAWNSGQQNYGRRQTGQYGPGQERGWNQERGWESRPNRGLDEDYWRRENQGYTGQYGQQGFSGQQANWGEGRGYGGDWRQGEQSWSQQNRGWEVQPEGERREFSGQQWQGRSLERGRNRSPEEYEQERFGRGGRGEEERWENQARARSQRHFQER